jgi:dephospho-CoA kinase
MLRIGLTGGIASGKSAVAAMLRELGFPVVDADVLVHALQEPGQAAHDEIVREFGPGVADGNGRIDRAKLGGIVFADPAKRARLNAILHPRVAEETWRQFADWEREGQDVAFVDAALLIEAGMHTKLDGVVVTWCRPEQQIARMRARGMSEEETLRRIAAQMPVEEKLRHAMEKIDTSGAPEDTRRQVEALAAKLRHAASKTGGN